MTNVVTISGRLTKDPELAYSPSGAAVCKTSVAVQRRFKDSKTGEYGVDFINIVAFSKSAEFLANNTYKGGRVNIVGHIQTGSYDKTDGSGRVYTFDVVVDQVEPVDWLKNRDQQQGGQQQQQGQQFGGYPNQQQFQQNNGGQPQYTTNQDPFANAQRNMSQEDINDQLPF